MLQRDSIQNTFIVAVGVCAVCSLLVSIAAVVLEPLKSANKERDRQVNILEVAGFDDRTIEDTGVENLFKDRIRDIVIDLETGEDVTSEYTGDAENEEEAREALAQFDQFKAPKTEDKEKANALSSSEDIATIKWQENHSHVYLLMSEDKTKVEKYIFPVRGYGLWSILYGFICLEADLETVAGITFYEHAETPGLGGEVDNRLWKADWRVGHNPSDKENPVRMKLYDESGEVALRVIKGQVNPSDPMAKYQVDGLSGATLTSNGVTNLLQFWMSDTGFKPYIEKERAKNSSSPSSVASNSQDNNTTNTNPANNQ